jgi:hypothetical protein
MSKDEKKRIVIGVSLCYFLIFTLIFLLTRFVPILFVGVKEISKVVRQSLPSFAALVLIVSCLMIFSIKPKNNTNYQYKSLILLISGTLLLISAIISVSNSATYAINTGIEISKMKDAINNSADSQVIYGSLYANISIAVLYFLQGLIGIILMLVAKKKERDIFAKSGERSIS